MKNVSKGWNMKPRHIHMSKMDKDFINSEGTSFVPEPQGYQLILVWVKGINI